MNLWAGLWRSFYSRAWYLELSLTSKRRSLQYILILAFVIVLLATVRFSFGFQRYSMAIVDYVAHSLPALRIQEGQLNTATPGVFRVYAGDKKTVLAIVDTSDEPSAAFVQSNAFIRLGRDYGEFKGLTGFEKLPYAHKNLTVTPAYLISSSKPYIAHINVYTSAFFFVFVYFCLVAFLFLFSYLMASLLTSLSSQFEYSLRYAHARRVVPAVLTPFLLFLVLFYLFTWFAPISVVILLLALVVYPALSVYFLKPKKGEKA